MKKVVPLQNDKTQATRVSSGQVLNAIADNFIGLLGGSGDVTPSTCTNIKNEKIFSPSSPEGRNIEFGIREHAMMGMSNGIQYFGLPNLVPYVSTFYIFVQYLLPSLRLAALEKLRVLLILTHDSIGLGEDGPTHQNVENFAIVRALPGALLFRPADLVETSGSYVAALSGPSRPAVFALSRQNLPPIPGATLDGVLKGGYIIKNVENPKAIIIGTGSETHIALKAAENLPVRVVSFPCIELFAEQTPEYQRSVLPSGIPIVSVEAGITFGWERYSHYHIGVDTYGTSAPAPQVYEHFGIVPNKIAEKLQKIIEFYSANPIPDLFNRFK